MATIARQVLVTDGRIILSNVEQQNPSAGMGTLRMASSEDFTLEIPVETAGKFVPGNVLEVSSEATVVGAFRARAEVFTVSPATDDQGRAVVSASLRFIGIPETERVELTKKLNKLCPTILLYGLDITPDEIPLPGFHVRLASTPEEIGCYFSTEEVAVLILGPRLSPEEASAVLRTCSAQYPHSLSLNIVLTVHSSNSLFQQLVDDDRLFYLAQGEVPRQQLVAIVSAAARLYRSKNSTRDSDLYLPTGERLRELCRDLLQLFEARDAGAVIADAARDILNANSARCIFFDDVTDTVWWSESTTGTECRESACTGLIGFVVRTRQGVRTNCALDDSRYDPDADNPGGVQSPHFIAAPVCDLDGRLIAVITALKSGVGNRFSKSDTELLESIVSCVYPVLAVTVQSASARDHSGVATQSPGLFRIEAVQRSVTASRPEGTLLQGVPGWLRWSHVLILLLVVGVLLYTAVARLHELATGSFLIRARDKTWVTSTSSGIVQSVAVMTGDRVKEGDLLVRLHSQDGDSLSTRIRQELRATSAGVIGDIRVRPGQSVTAGDLIASVVDEDAGNEMIAFLPGSYAPQVRPGMDVVLVLEGYPDSREVIPIDYVGSEIIGAQEASRYAGRESSGTLNITGPVVIVHSLMRKWSFEADGMSYSYRDGMTGRAEISIRSDRVIVTLIPGLRELLRHPSEVWSIR